MKRVIVMMLAALTIFGTGLQASDKYGSGKQFADSLKGSGSGVLNNFNPGEVIPGYTENPPESAHYGGVTSSNSASLESAGASALNNSEVGKLTSEVIMNRPKDPISMDAPFISGGFDVQDKADIVTNGTYDKCETVNVSKTEITSHVCERTPAAELTCTRKASIKDNVVRKTVRKTYQKVVTLGYNARNVKWSGAFNIPEKGRLLHVAVDGERLVVPWSSKCDRESVTYECKASVKETLSIMGKELPIDILMYPREDSICSGGVNTHCTYHTRNGWGQIHQAFDTDMQVSAGQSFPVVKTSKTFNWYSNQESVQVTITLTLDVEVTEHKPSVEWVETCPFNKAEEVLQGSQCTEAGGNRTINIDGKTYTVYSDCWAWKDTYLKQEADNGSCDVYMKDPACTVSRVNCQEKSGSACLQEEVTFSCEKKVTGEAQLCSGQLVCANGECDAIENNTSDGFGKAVSALAAVTAAAKDVAAMNDVNVRAFTGKPVECRMAIAGFSNCCKDSGWGQGIGLAHCDSEEKALGKAKEKLLTVYVGTYCSKKALGVCLQKKKAYCQFDSKLAQIVQAQGRKGQLGIGFGSGKHPDCRGITVEELQSLRFDRMDFSNFYSDLNAGTTIPSDSELAERVKEQVASALQQSAGKGQ
ncbi:type-F conjugative transfer system mating-pair stabilization protein TraN [Escherichia coli]|uniref:type-F conjugative transfer system mating-pair stabilization protein TraN n=2 Tax=Escherichia coli TaxID=562 RepID=UPI000B7E7FCF|nr:type-F conjugative transfer system mating-pair stabilization protein TraN [Escherichia coli]EEY5704327.1 type-F conjugative transfer system mating-pair stabilization protein TraN [Escherichia coli]EFA7545793.1 type-F conjugative transfer system mating-pair stabilization protein TraN [Escherichia coli]EFA7621676.1 type-F conjugative transfer system mating-pair stabilization protein TraN [Escherichia coli]EFH7778990.1 type-F conjugative transfer system mating-pair stabilization protein TraN [E